MNATTETFVVGNTTRQAGAAQAWFLVLAMFLPILAIVVFAVRAVELLLGR